MSKYSYLVYVKPNINALNDGTFKELNKNLLFSVENEMRSSDEFKELERGLKEVIPEPLFQLADPEQLHPLLDRIDELYTNMVKSMVLTRNMIESVIQRVNKEFKVDTQLLSSAVGKMYRLDKFKKLEESLQAYHKKNPFDNFTDSTELIKQLESLYRSMVTKTLELAEELNQFRSYVQKGVKRDVPESVQANIVAISEKQADKISGFVVKKFSPLLKKLLSPENFISFIQQFSSEENVTTTLIHIVKKSIILLKLQYEYGIDLEKLGRNDPVELDKSDFLMQHDDIIKNVSSQVSDLVNLLSHLFINTLEEAVINSYPALSHYFTEMIENRNKNQVKLLQGYKRALIVSYQAKVLHHSILAMESNNAYVFITSEYRYQDSIYLLTMISIPEIRQSLQQHMPLLDIIRQFRENDSLRSIEEEAVRIDTKLHELLIIFCEMRKYFTENIFPSYIKSNPMIDIQVLEQAFSNLERNPEYSTTLWRIVEAIKGSTTKKRIESLDKELADNLTIYVRKIVTIPEPLSLSEQLRRAEQASAELIQQEDDEREFLERIPKILVPKAPSATELDRTESANSVASEEEQKEPVANAVPIVQPVLLSNRHKTPNYLIKDSSGADNIIENEITSDSVKEEIRRRIEKYRTNQIGKGKKVVRGYHSYDEHVQSTDRPFFNNGPNERNTISMADIANAWDSLGFGTVTPYFNGVNDPAHPENFFLNCGSSNIEDHLHIYRYDPILRRDVYGRAKLKFTNPQRPADNHVVVMVDICHNYKKEDAFEVAEYLYYVTASVLRKSGTCNILTRKTSPEQFRFTGHKRERNRYKKWYIE